MKVHDVNGNGSYPCKMINHTRKRRSRVLYSEMTKFGELTFGDMTFSEVTCGEITTVGEITFGDLTFGEVL